MEQNTICNNRFGWRQTRRKIPMHVHAKGCYELHFITEGKGTLIADGREIELKKNDFSLQGRILGIAKIMMSKALLKMYLY